MKFICPPMSRKDLRAYALSIRKSLHAENSLAFPVLPFLEIMPEIFEKDNFSFEIVGNNDLPPDIHAEYDYNINCIRIKDFVYEGACEGKGRDRMTIIHEISHHLLLSHSGLQLHRSFSDTVPTYRDPEWQAKCLAGEIMVPAHLVSNMDAQEIANKCLVSFDAALYQSKMLTKK